jgi:hypothetical protein
VLLRKERPACPEAFDLVAETRSRVPHGTGEDFCFYSLRDVKSFGEESSVEEFADYGQQAIHPSHRKTKAFWPSSVVL